MLPSLYQNLDLHDFATIDVVHKCYRKMTKKHHPDAGGSHEKMVHINLAYEVLGHADAKNAYDRRLLEYINQLDLSSSCNSSNPATMDASNHSEAAPNSQPPPADMMDWQVWFALFAGILTGAVYCWLSDSPKFIWCACTIVIGLMISFPLSVSLLSFGRALRKGFQKSAGDV